MTSNAEDYAASGETGWFYGIMDGEYDIEGDDPYRAAADPEAWPDSWQQAWVRPSCNMADCTSPTPG